MEGKDNIKELFSQKLGNYEAKVNPELWAKISSQVAAGATTTAATGLSVFAKVVIGLGISAAAITTVVLLTTSSEKTVLEKPIVEVQKEIPSTNTIDTETIVEQENQETAQVSDVQNDLNNITSPISPAIPIPGENDRDRKRDFVFNHMPMRKVDNVNDGNQTEPKIIEGVRYVDMTNYGSAAANTPDIAPEVIAPQPEAVKRYVNVFTPNGDGANDYFELESEGLTNFSVVVFDPKGDIVFKSEDPDFRWDGRAMKTGETVESGTYMYMVSAYDAEGNPYPIYERLTIKR